MAEHAMSGSDPLKTTPSADAPLERPHNAKFETDLADLASRFSAQSGGGLSPELSADLALEIVLNEIVEQACLATSATGAAIVLKREGEMVCRASSGSTAPELGSRLDTSSGLSGECFKTRRTQWCDDTMSDQRADAKASERLGVRSVVVMPLLRGETILGVIELFSSQPYAFGVRDERTLEILADRTLNNLDSAARPLELQKAPESAKAPLYWSIQDQSSQPENGGGQARAATDDAGSRIEQSRTPTQSAHEGVKEVPSKDTRSSNKISLESGYYETSATAERRNDRKQERTKDWRSDGWNTRSASDSGGWLLGAAAVACAILLGLVVGRHWGSRSAASHAHPRINKSAGATAPTPTLAKGTDHSTSTATTNPGGGQVPLPGGLLVSENGKEVFRVPPKGSHPTTAADQAIGVKRAAAVEPDGVIQLSPTAAEDSLLERVEPDYPEAAREQNIQGVVVLEVHIAADGSVQDIQVISGPAVLAEAATAAVKQWKFKPKLVKGSPVEMQTRITLNFRLPPQKLPQ
jgi:TonB family protein